MTRQDCDTILVVEDDPGMSEVVQFLLVREGYRVERAGSFAQVRRRIPLSTVNLVITDLKLPDGTGLEVVRAIRDTDRELPIVMITSYSSMESAIAALRAGAVDYLVKPFDNDEFLHAVRRALDEHRMRRENAALRRNLRNAYAPPPILGESPGIRRVLDLVRRIGTSDTNVLISGESGTGKESVALHLHHLGPRAGGPFVPVSCGAFTPSKLESELFGAPASTAPQTEGLIREAHGGTLFLDEVAELPQALQARLLRVIEDKAVRPVGAAHPLAADVRVLAATTRDLGGPVAQGQFRKDLYYSLNVVPVEVPSLRDRGGDIVLLATHFLEAYNRKFGRNVRAFDAEFTGFMLSYRWPGNVRELENFIERSVLLAQGDLLTGRDLAEVAPALPMVRASEPLPGGGRPLAIEEYVREVIERFQGSHTDSDLARMLGIGRKALWMRRRQWGLKRARKTPD